jgi:hypothetical protein
MEQGHTRQPEETQPETPAPASSAAQEPVRGRQRPLRPKGPPRKIDLKTAFITALVLILATIVLMLVMLLPGYNRYNNIQRVVATANRVDLSMNSDIGILEEQNIDPVRARSKLISLLLSMGAKDADVRIDINYPGDDQQQNQTEQQGNGGNQP